MRRDLDELAWWWLVLGGAVGLLHLGLAFAAVQLGWLGFLILPPEFGVVGELTALAVWAGLGSFVLLPVLSAFLLGKGLLERRWWSLHLAVAVAAPFLIIAPPFGLIAVAATLRALADPSVRQRLTAEGDAPLGWRLDAVMRLHGHPIASAGESAEAPPVAWARRERFAVVEGDAQLVVDPDHPAALPRGLGVLAVSVMPEIRIRRWVEWSIAGSLVWLAIVSGASVSADQGKIVWDIVHCELFGIGCPVPGEGNPGTAFSAEYLARLLREDYAGQDQGVMDPNMDRPEAERKAKDEKHFYLPAGSRGPVTEMGGAEDVSPEPVRTPETEETSIPVPKKKRPTEPVAVAEAAEPVAPDPKEAEDGVADAAEDDPPDSPESDEVRPAPPAEEKRGWGVQDWYDEQDQRLDALEIKLMIKMSKERLRLDPMDPGALSILSYYQYLAEDYSAAEATYDKYISVLPEEAAGYNNKALVYKRRGEYVKEEGLYRVALAFEPDDETALNNLGVNLAHQGRIDEALAVMKRLEVLDPGDPYADLHRSKIYAQKGDDEVALRYLEQALRGMAELDTLHHIEFRQDIRLDPSFEHLRTTERFRSLLLRYYGKDSPLQEP